MPVAAERSKLRTVKRSGSVEPGGSGSPTNSFSSASGSTLAVICATAKPATPEEESRLPVRLT